jgi:hypothetical protein
MDCTDNTISVHRRANLTFPTPPPVFTVFNLSIFFLKAYILLLKDPSPLPGKFSAVVERTEYFVGWME